MLIVENVIGSYLAVKEIKDGKVQSGGVSRSKQETPTLLSRPVLEPHSKALVKKMVWLTELETGQVVLTLIT